MLSLLSHDSSSSSSSPTLSPDLTWRDAQYIIIHSSNPSLLADGEWVTNGAGLRVSHRYGFGIMDAAALVNRARNWSTVPERLSCNVTAQLSPRSVVMVTSNATITCVCLHTAITRLLMTNQ